MTQIGEKIMEANETLYYPEFRIYKPRNTGDGAASRLQFKVSSEKYGPRPYLFWEAAKQTGVDENKNAKFAWTEPKNMKVTMKLEEPDIGEILSVLHNFKDYVGTDPKKGMYHQNPSGNTVMRFSKMSKDGAAPNYYINLSAKKKDMKDAISVQHVISLSEAMIVRILLTDAVSRMYRWKS